MPKKKSKAHRWKAKFAGTCAKCKAKFQGGEIIASELGGYVHNRCHSDWHPPKDPFHVTSRDQFGRVKNPVQIIDPDEVVHP